MILFRYKKGVTFYFIIFSWNHKLNGTILPNNQSKLIIDVYKVWQFNSWKRPVKVCLACQLVAVTFKVRLFSNYIPCEIMVSLLETFLDHVFWNTFQQCRNVLLDIKDFIKSFLILEVAKVCWMNWMANFSNGFIS